MPDGARLAPGGRSGAAGSDRRKGDEVEGKRDPIQVWDLWYPKAAAQGLPFARGRLDATDRLLVHAAPETLDVAVRSDAGELIAAGKGLTSTGDFPMALLTIRGSGIEREDRWPLPSEIGLPVILPGGEVGILQSWWNAPDGSEWRWQVEFSNHR